MIRSVRDADVNTAHIEMGGNGKEQPQRMLKRRRFRRKSGGREAAGRNADFIAVAGLQFHPRAHVERKELKQ